jgi:lysophospholipase L1-like esterase
MRARNKIIVTLLAGLVGFVAIELVVRAVYIGPIPAPGDKGEIGRKSPDPDLRNELIPGSQLRTQFRNRRKEIVREIDVAVNEQGFRGPVVPQPKPTGTFRIVCLGDSQTFGNGVGEGESWPAVMDATLHERDKDARIDVMNCGVGGYDTEQEIAYLEHRLLVYDPDLVIVGFFMNDTAVIGATLESPAGFSAKLIRWLVPGAPGFLHGVRKTSRIVDLGADWLFRRLTMKRWIGDRMAYYAPDYAGWIRVQKAIVHTRDMLAARGTRFVFLFVPLLMRDGDDLVSELPYRTLSAFLDREKVPYFDPAPLFAGLDVDHMRVHERDIHTDASGHRIIGRAMASWLLEHGLVAPVSSR